MKVKKRIWECVKRALPKSLKTCLWLLKIILPVSLLVRLLQYSGVLAEFSVYLEPLFSHLGLPGETAIVFLTSVFTPLYAPLAIIMSMSLTVREITLLGLMCLLSHNLFVECAVQAKTGSSFVGIFIMRIVMSFVVAFTVNLVMPHGGFDVLVGSSVSAENCSSLLEVFVLWLKGSLSIAALFGMIVTALMILHYIFDEFKLMDGLSALMSPLMKFFGLPHECAFLWLVGNIVGLSYGSAIMMEQMDAGKISRHNGNLLNHHLAISHSLFEDTAIFVALGAPFLWIVLTRLFFAVIIVWGRRLVDSVVSPNPKKMPSPIWLLLLFLV